MNTPAAEPSNHLQSYPRFLLWLLGVAGSALLIQTRLLFPLFPLLALAAAVGVAGLQEIDSNNFKLSWIVRVIVALTLALTLVGFGTQAARQRPVETLLGLRSNKSTLVDQLGWHQVAIEAINELPNEPQVLFLWEPRSFYCRADCRPDALLDRWWHLRQQMDTPEEIAARWQSEGVTHVLLYRVGMEATRAEGLPDPLTAADRLALLQLIENHLVEIEDLGNVYQLYALEAAR